MLILSIFLTVIFFATIFYKKGGTNVTKENFLSIDPKFDIVNPSFTINNAKEKISVTADKGNFLNNNQIFLKTNVFFTSANFTLLSDEVTYDKKNNIINNIFLFILRKLFNLTA